VRWYRRRDANARPREVDTAIDPEVGGDRIALWKTKEQVDEVDYGPIWIASANDPNETLEGPGLRLTWGGGRGVRAQARAPARGRL